MAGETKKLRSVHNAPDVKTTFDKHRDPQLWAGRTYLQRTTEEERREESTARGLMQRLRRPLTGVADMIKRQKPVAALRPPPEIRQRADKVAFDGQWLKAQHAAAMAQANDQYSLNTQPTQTHKKGLDMTTQQNAGPLTTHKDGALSVKVWRNVSQQGDIFYNTTVQRSYKDAQSGEWRETNNLRPDDLLKVQNLSQEAYQSIRQAQAQDHSRSQQQQEWQQQQQGQDNTPQQHYSEPSQKVSMSMEDQYREAMSQAASEQNHAAPAHSQNRPRGPKP